MIKASISKANELKGAKPPFNNLPSFVITAEVLSFFGFEGEIRDLM